MEWSEFSFILKPSVFGGIDVFATHDIPSGTAIFNYNYSPHFRTLKIKNVPTQLLKYCIYISDEECLCPERFDRMEIGWYLNHSHTPNIGRTEAIVGGEMINERRKRNLYTIVDIKAGDEILIDYNELKEPEQLKEDYYKK